MGATLMRRSTVRRTFPMELSDFEVSSTRGIRASFLLISASLSFVEET